MPGMNSGLNADDPTVVAAFRSALLHQGLIALAIFAVLSVVWVSVRGRPGNGATAPAAQPEPAGHQVVRIGFGLLWIFDGLLQAQPRMAAGLPSQVIEPAAASSPHWVQHLVNWAGTTWSYHPIQAGAAAVWIQIGIGLWMLAAPRGVSARLAGAASLAWGLIVWIFGEAFGSIFAPGLTWLFGAPGAALIYAIAGALLALPDRSWRSPRLGRAVLAGLGLFLVGMAVLQAWPGRGFWQGRSGGQPGTLTGMVQSMAETSQPRFLSSLVSGFGVLVSDHGFAVNLVTVVALAVIGAAFLTGRRELARPALAAFLVLCLADWVLIEDFGFLGGVGTDPNSMIPMALVCIAGYLALTRPVGVASADVVPIGRVLVDVGSWRQRLVASPSYAFRFVAASAAIGIVLVGGIPMAVAAASPNADPILATAVDGTPDLVNYPAPTFTLVDQHNQPVSLASLRGKTIALTFLDPVCTSDCPIIAQELRRADGLLGGAQSHVEFVAVNLNPLYTAPQYLVAFDRQESLNQLGNWLYLTGPTAQLRRVWASFGVLDEYSPAGAMIAHSDVAYVIDATGHTRVILNTDPGPGTATTESSLAATIVNEVDTVRTSS